MRAPLLALAALLGFAPAVDASTLKFDTSQRKVSYEGAAGEVNQVTATQEGGLVRIVDAGATISVQPGACRAVSANEATCPISDPRNVVKLVGGDQDDHLTFTGTVSAQLDGADGADTLTGSEGADTLEGGGGADTLVCGANVDAGAFDAADVIADDCEFKPAPLDPAAPAAGLTGTAAPVADAAPAGGLDLGAADPAAIAALPAPQPGRAVSAAPASGTVLVRRAGGTSFKRLDPARPVPVGSIIDARRGSVTLVAAKDLAGARQQATFAGGMFRVSQKRAKAMTTVLTLRGTLDCGSNLTTARSAAGKRRRSRSLWGDGHGRFTTRGRNSQATVRGTIWGVTDRCDGTLTQVKRGAVAVKDLRTGKTRVVRAGGRYLARKRA